MRGLYDLAFVIEESVFTALRANTALVAKLGNNAGAIRQTRTHQKLLVPSIGVFRVADAVDELEVPVLLQFDWFAPSVNAARELRKMTLQTVLSDYTFTLGNLQLWARYQGGGREEDPEAGVAHLRGDVEFHPYRELSHT